VLQLTIAGRWQLIYKKEHKNYIEARRHEKWLKKKNINYKNNISQLAPPIKGGVNYTNCFARPAPCGRDKQ